MIDAQSVVGIAASSVEIDVPSLVETDAPFGAVMAFPSLVEIASPSLVVIDAVPGVVFQSWAEIDALPEVAFQSWAAIDALPGVELNVLCGAKGVRIVVARAVRSCVLHPVGQRCSAFPYPMASRRYADLLKDVRLVDYHCGFRSLRGYH